MNIALLALRCGVVCLMLIMAACIQLDPLASERLAEGAAAPATIGSSDQLEPGSPTRVDAAMRHSARLQAEHEQEERRKAAESLDYFGIGQGMVVLGLHAGGEHYAELLPAIVGPTGRVVVHDNMPYLSFARNELATLYVDQYLDNAAQTVTVNNQFRLAPNVFDAVIMIKSYRDAYFVSEETGWVEIDRAAMLHEIFTTLKSGGVLGIVDHAAAPGVQSETGSRLRRIDPATIKRDMAAAGFRFDDEIDTWRNPDDDHARSIFAPPVRDRTDSVILRFYKP